MDFDAPRFGLNFKNPTNGFNPWDNLRPGDIVTTIYGGRPLAEAYFVAFVGALAAYECLSRRTHMMGAVNWILHFLAAFYMGGVGLWGMHYVATKGTKMGWGDESMQTVQNLKMTIISFFAPIGGLFVAYFILGTAEKPKKLRIFVSGMLSGGITAGNYYLSHLGITNYKIAYSWSHTLCSILVACISNIFIFYTFMRLRSKYGNRWFKQIFLAMATAASTAGMHYTAQTGTTYYAKKDTKFRHNLALGPHIHLALVLLSTLTAGSIFLAVVIGRVYRKRVTRKADDVILGSVTYTHDGRIMVKADGTIPSVRICPNFNDGTIDEILDNKSSVFHWMYRISRDWPAIVALIPGLKRHQRFLLEQEEDKDLDMLDSRKFSIWFREGFMLAAAKLANQLAIPLSAIGVLYDEVFRCGHKLEYTYDKENDIERALGLSTQGKGRLLILVRKIGPKEMHKMGPLGYRFTKIENAEKTLAWCTQISRSKIVEFLKSAAIYSTDTLSRIPLGMYIGAFAVRASVAGGFEIVTDPRSRFQIPTCKIPVDYLYDTQLGLMTKYDGKPLAELMKGLEYEYQTANVNNKFFLKAFHLTLRSFILSMPQELWQNCHFIAKPELVPCRDEQKSYAMALVWVLQTVIPAEGENQGNMKFSPVKLLSVKQKIRPEDIYHFHMATMREFIPLLKDMHRAKLDDDSPANQRFWPRGSVGSNSTDFTGASTETNCSLQYTKKMYKNKEAWDPKLPDVAQAEDTPTYVDIFFDKAMDFTKKNRQLPIVQRCD